VTSLSVLGTDLVCSLSITSSRSFEEGSKFEDGDPKMQSSALQFPKSACSCEEKDVEGYPVDEEEEPAPRRSPEASTAVTKKTRKMTSSIRRCMVSDCKASADGRSDLYMSSTRKCCIGSSYD
jgi:hypothetical protein